MPTNTIFISYSRKDSEFMTEFSKKLRDAGANLWSDKQIVPGGLWDNSIETALKTCDIIIVLISKASVNSNNVMDEVSYALEENKKVIPVVLEQCELPFRLRRIQFIDLTQNSEKGLNLLKSTLNLTSKPAPIITPKSAIEPKPVLDSEIVKEIPKQKTIIPDKPKENVKTATVNSTQPNKTALNKILKITVPIALIVIAFFVYPLVMNNTKLGSESNNKSNNIEFSTESKADNNTRSINQVGITDTITQIEEPIPVKTDATEWEIVKQNNDIAQLENHITTFPDCTHVLEATTIIDDLKLKIEEENLFNIANTSKSLLSYIIKYGKQGTYYSEALKALDTHFTSSGYVQFSASNGELYFNVFENDTKKIPEVEDLIIAKKQRRIHLGPLNSSNYNIINHTTSKDEFFKVVEVTKLGAAYWVKVTF
jgi:hypothetical protein